MMSNQALELKYTLTHADRAAMAQNMPNGRSLAKFRLLFGLTSIFLAAIAIAATIALVYALNPYVPDVVLRVAVIIFLILNYSAYHVFIRYHIVEYLFFLTWKGNLPTITITVDERRLVFEQKDFVASIPLAQILTAEQIKTGYVFRTETSLGYVPLRAFPTEEAQRTFVNAMNEALSKYDHRVHLTEPRDVTR